MTPFPEAEIMTIKRLEVALRKMDYKLLKDGAYKLHEKYHSGHRFEYLDLLKDLYVEISNNPNVPEDIKDILSPTIEDILSQGNVKIDREESPYEKEEDRVSTLTSLAYNTNNNQETTNDNKNSINQNNQIENNQEEKLDAFDAFSAEKPHIEPYHRTLIQSPFSAEPFKEFNKVSYTPIIPHSPIQNINQITEPNNIQIQEARNEELIKEQVEEKKSIAIFYSQSSSMDKINNILKYRELINNSEDNNSSLSEVIELTKKISLQADSSTSELQGVLEQTTSKGNKISLITNSQSSDIFNTLNNLNISYCVNKEENNKLSLMALFGLSNLYSCIDCKEEYLNLNDYVKPFVLECPTCKNAMYKEFYAPTENAQINMETYNKSLISMANSEVWLLIHPSFNDKISSELIETAFNVSNQVKEVYVLDKDINVREGYKNTLSNIKPNVKFNIQGNILEEFFRNI